MAQDEIDERLDTQHPAKARSVDFPPVEDKSRGAAPRSIKSLGDVNITLTLQLGTSGMLVKDILQLRSGSVVELDKLAGEQLDVYLNDVFFARGEVVVIGDTIGVRITEIVGQEESEQDAD